MTATELGKRDVLRRRDTDPQAVQDGNLKLKPSASCGSAHIGAKVAALVECGDYGALQLAKWIAAGRHNRRGTEVRLELGELELTVQLFVS